MMLVVMFWLFYVIIPVCLLVGLIVGAVKGFKAMKDREAHD